MHSKRNVLTTILAIILVISLLLPPIPVAALETDPVSPRSSAYLHSYKAYIYDAGHGDLQIWFNVCATGTMDEIGALTIVLKESSDGGITWRTAKTFRSTTYSSMLASNRYLYLSDVEYGGTVGHKYYAYVTVWAGRNGGGDSREILTSIVTLS